MSKKTIDRGTEYVPKPQKPPEMSELDNLTAWRTAIITILTMDAGHLVEQLSRPELPYSLVDQTVGLVAQGGAALKEANRQVEAEVNRLGEQGREDEIERDLTRQNLRG